MFENGRFLTAMLQIFQKAQLSIILAPEILIFQHQNSMTFFSYGDSVFSASKKITTALIASLLSGCALSPAEFREKRYEVSDTRLCTTLRNATSAAVANGEDSYFEFQVRAEVERRGLDDESCARLERNQAIAIGVGVLAGAALVASSRGGGAVAGGATGYASTAYDYDWEWDQFYNQNRFLVWACRGVQTGQFAEQYRCAGKLQTDWKWPGK